MYVFFQEEHERSLEESSSSIEELTRQLRQGKQQHLQEEDRLTRLLHDTQIQLDSVGKCRDNRGRAG